MKEEPEYLEPDPKYISDRNSCIPLAEWFTNKHCGRAYTGLKSDVAARDKWNSKWTKTFIRRMDHLYRELSAEKGNDNEASNARKDQGSDLPGDQDQATETRKVLGLRSVGDEIETVLPNAQPA
jgi:hypothetical protein